MFWKKPKNANQPGNPTPAWKSDSLAPGAGITLVELLVSIFIIMTITVVVVYNHRAFTDNLEITNLAFDIALTIRESQVSGIAVQQAPGSGGFENAFGVHFLIRGNSGNNKAVIRFVDLDDNSLYSGNFNDCSSNAECLDRIDIGRGNKISYICYRKDNQNLKCGSANVGAPSGVNLSFLRPKPDASIMFINSGGEHMVSDDGEILDGREAVICLESPLGRKKSIHVLPTGQISVQNGGGCSLPGGGLGGGGMPGGPGGGGPFGG